MSSRSSLEIKAEAARLGFFSCGIAKAEAVDEQTAHSLRQWLNEGNHASMSYMENHLQKRLDPTLLVPGVKSIICVALNYAPAQRMPEGSYQIAAYAYGQDYHDIVRKKLHELAAFIQNGDAGVHYRAFCDTAPILERYWAVKAGLGWIGRHHQLVVPNAGSMFFLGELFVDVELPADHPVENRCGQCHKCTDACPTHAISYHPTHQTTFCAHKCLSYQTIENRGDIPAVMAQHIHPYIYGCDRCLTACPWNRFAVPTTEPMLQPQEELMKMTREMWGSLTEDDFNRLFKCSAVKRTKYAGLIRNINILRNNHHE